MLAAIAYAARLTRLHILACRSRYWERRLVRHRQIVRLMLDEYRAATAAALEAK